ncbi:unnamed protein product, partial [Brenthis ino]
MSRQKLAKETDNDSVLFIFLDQNILSGHKKWRHVLVCICDKQDIFVVKRENLIKMGFHLDAVFLMITNAVLSCLAGDLVISPKDDPCRSFSSCATCISQSACTWCVTKSLCTKQLCGNDNVIYPEGNSNVLLFGPDFCPRIAETKDLIFESGKRKIVDIKITQIYLYMAFLPWKCKINLNGEETIVTAMLIGDSVYCESFEMNNKSENPYVEGTIKVLWDYNKAFDGSFPFKVCRCDLEPNCVACNKIDKK